MKTISYYLLLVVSVMCGLQSCDDSKTYAEMREEEEDAINAYITRNNISVISQSEFERDSITEENEYVLLDESGIYMHIDQIGQGTEVLEDGNYTILTRFMEIALQERSEMFHLGDTLVANMRMNGYPSLQTNPEELMVTIADGAYSATFGRYQYSLMYTSYQSTAVPSGWLVPLRYLRPTRTQSSSDVARVKLIVPHDQGTTNASRYVYPCFYELTYNMR